MLNDWFTNLQWPLEWETFCRLPRHPAFRYEYRQGQIRISGNPRYHHCLLDLEPLSSATSAISNEIRPLSQADWDHLPLLFADAFSSVPPWRHRSVADRTEAARQLLTRTRQQQDGPLVSSACFVLPEPELSELSTSVTTKASAVHRERRLGGAILVTLIPSADLHDFSTADWSKPPPKDPELIGWGQPHLTWIFVRSGRKREGVGRSLLFRSAEALRTRGYSQLASTFLMGDHVSTLWHWRIGFRLLPHPGSPAK